MKSFTTFRFAFAMLLATGFLISVFILLYSYSSDKEVKDNLLDNTSVNNSSAAEIISNANSNLRTADTPADSNSKKYPKKSAVTVSYTNGKDNR
jgi:hypothetical protein